MLDFRTMKIILGVVDEQLETNNPPCTREIYERLVIAGYSEPEAKDKIGAVALTEMYNVWKAGEFFRGETYKNSLEEMLRQSLDYEDAHPMETGTEWDAWDALVQKGYRYFKDQEPEDGLLFWKDAWNVFCAIMERASQTGTLYGLMDSLGYIYPVDGWLQDYEMELGNARRYMERIVFCQKVLELFDWQEDDCSCFQCGIGDSLFYQGKVSEAYEHYEKWLEREPQNVNGIHSFSWILFENGEEEKAYEVVRKAIWGLSCHADNSFLFMRAKKLARHVGKMDEGKWYQQKLDEFEQSIGIWRKTDDIG